MAQSFFHQSANSGSHSTVSNCNDSDSKDGDDDETLRYNKRLKDRRDRLLQELTRLENDNKIHCDKLRDLLKPLQLINKDNNKNKTNKDSKLNKTKKTIDDEIAARMSKYSDDEDEENEYESKLNSAALDGIEEFKIPTITSKMDDELQNDFLSLLIRYLCLANNYRRNEIKSLYAKQTSLYFQAQGLSLDEQRQFLETLCHPIPAFEPIEKQNNASIQQLLAKFPDPHHISQEYEKYIRLTKEINANSPDLDINWQSSVIKASIDELQPQTPILNSNHSQTESKNNNENYNKNNLSSKPKPKHRTRKSGLFGFRRKKSEEKVAYTIDIKTPQTELKTNNTSTTTPIENDNISVASSPKSMSYDTQKAVAMMGSQANAPSIASTSRNTAISGARLIRFDSNYKSLQSRRQRCDIASVISALQNTHSMHIKMKQRVPNTLNENPFLVEENFGFDMRYTNHKMYTYDTIITDSQILKKHKDEKEQNNIPMTPAMNAINSPLNLINNNTFILNETIEKGSSRNLHTMINSMTNGGGGFPNIDSITESINLNQKRTHKESDSMNENMTNIVSTVSKPIMNVNNQNNIKKRPGWITLNQFIHLATNFGAHGLRDAQVLILTHKIFCESKLLLKGLRKRFWMPIPPNITPSEIIMFRQTYVKQIRGKIIAVLRYWLTKHWNDDFRYDFKLQHKMNKFITEINENKESESMSIYLAQAFEKEKKNSLLKKNKNIDDHDATQEEKLKNTTQKKKVLKFFYDAKTMDILDFKPEETAACIVELNCKSFLLIDQRECFEWIKNKQKAPHVAAMIGRWNAMGNWVQRELLSLNKQRDFKKRLQCLKYFISIVNILSDLGDFSGAYAINSALHSTPVHRLKKYFDELNKKEHQTLKEMRELFAVSGNYPNLRVNMKNYLSKPCVPHIGLFTRDLTMLAEQKSTKMIKNKKYINFGKCQTLAKQIGDLKMYQNNINKFNLKYQKPLLDYVETQLENPIKSENDLYKMSIIVEPKASSNV